MTSLLSEWHQQPNGTSTGEPQFKLYYLDVPEVAWTAVFTFMFMQAILFFGWLVALLHRHIIYRRKNCR